MTAASRSVAGLTVTALLLLAGCGTAPPPAPPAPEPPASVTVVDGPLGQRLTAAVSTDGAWPHLEALQRIADANGGNRAAGTPGYEASVAYVTGVLQAAGFAVTAPTYEAEGDDGVGAGTGRNVLAQTRTGDPGRVVMIGAHLDSVPEGPGIVDDGTGVAALLEIATHLGPDPEVRNAVRFAFFGHEETGAEGSTAYVEGLAADELARIALYLNVDMVGSPNGGYIVQGGVGDGVEETGPAGSEEVARVLADQLTRAGVTAPETVAFVGDDETAFVEAGIPVGGAENGDAEEKTAAQAQAWGGQAGEVYDRCYHRACDRLDSVNREVFDRYLRALAGTLAHFATGETP